jgi:hypothetical protein
MNTPHFIPQLGQVLTTLSAEGANYRLIASADETAVYGKQVSEHGAAIYVVTQGPQRLISTITSELSVATFASTLPERRRRP